MSTRSNKGIGLLLVELLDLERVIHKSKRGVDTLQAAIGSVEIQASIDTIHPTSIDTVHPTSIDLSNLCQVTLFTMDYSLQYCSSRYCSSRYYTVHLPSIDTIHPASIDTVHLPSIDTFHLPSIDTVYRPSIDTVHPASIDTVHPASIDTVHPDTVHQLLDDTMAKRDEQHVSGELSKVEEAGTEDSTSTFTDGRTSTSTDGKTSTSTDGRTLTSPDSTTSMSTDSTTSTSTDGTTSMSTDGTTSTSIDITTSTLIDDVDREITMDDSLELEEWLEDMDQNSKKKLDDDQHTSRGDMETSKASIGRPHPDEIDRQPPHIDRHRQPLIDRHDPPNIDRCPLLDVPPGCIIEMEPIEERMYMSKASHLAVPKHQRPPIWTEEAAGFHKSVKRIHDPVKIVVPCAVFEAESPIPPDRSMQFNSYFEVLDDHQHVEASQKGLRF
uniref:Uncharacterized protein n=1 Tax=Brassica oleracea var. oleracea TaxID=109376 RepID=A0A0D3BGK9_BRAOL